LSASAVRRRRRLAGTPGTEQRNNCRPIHGKENVFIMVAIFEALAVGRRPSSLW